MNKKKVLGGIGAFLVFVWIIGKMSSCSGGKDTVDTGQSTSQPRDKWHVSEDRSPMDDSKTVVLQLDSDDVLQGPIGNTKPSLIVRCKEKETAVYVVTGIPASIEEASYGGPSGFHRVRLRLDDDVPSIESWWGSSDHKALFGDHSALSGDAVAFAKKLASVRTLTFEFTPFDSGPQAVRFDVRGLGTHLHKVADACGWTVG